MSASRSVFDIAPRIVRRLRVRRWLEWQVARLRLDEATIMWTDGAWWKGWWSVELPREAQQADLGTHGMALAETLGRMSASSVSEPVVREEYACELERFLVPLGRREIIEERDWKPEEGGSCGWRTRPVPTFRLFLTDAELAHAREAVAEFPEEVEGIEYFDWYQVTTEWDLLDVVHPYCRNHKRSSIWDVGREWRYSLRFSVGDRSFFYRVDRSDGVVLYTPVGVLDGDRQQLNEPWLRVVDRPE